MATRNSSTHFRRQGISNEFGIEYVCQVIRLGMNGGIAGTMTLAQRTNFLRSWFSVRPSKGDGQLSPRPRIWPLPGDRPQAVGVTLTIPACSWPNCLTSVVRLGESTKVGPQLLNRQSISRIAANKDGSDPISSPQASHFRGGVLVQPMSIRGSSVVRLMHKQE